MEVLRDEVLPAGSTEKHFVIPGSSNFSTTTVDEFALVSYIFVTPEPRHRLPPQRILTVHGTMHAGYK